MSAVAEKVTSSGKKTASATRPTPPGRAAQGISLSPIQAKATVVGVFASGILAQEHTSTSLTAGSYQLEEDTDWTGLEELVTRYDWPGPELTS